MQKYFYFGVRLEQLVVSATGASRKRQIVRWHKTVFGTIDEAAQAAAKKMITHPGVSYFVQGFERKLVIDENGESKGFEAEKEGV